jgi:exopolysaccharide biosynthesis polyprenyl glycosylphosphotransferase
MLRRNTNYIILSFIFDLLCIFAAIFLAQFFRASLPIGHPLRLEPGLEILLLEAGLIYPLVFLLFSLYDPERTFRAVDEFQIITISSFISALALAGLILFTARDISRLFLIYFYVFHFVLMICWRSLSRLIRKNQNGRGRDLRKVLLIGGGEAAKQAIERLHELAWAGVHLVGYLTDGQPIPSANGTIPLLGSLKEAERIIQKYNVNDVLIALPAESYNKVQHLVTRLIDKPSNIWVVQDYFSLLLYGAYVEDLGGVPMISLKAPTLTGYQRLVKRVFDLVLGSILLLFFLPVMGLIALAIKFDSPGPALFKQRRVGENGCLFSMFKFRTMVTNADKMFNEVIHYDEQGRIIHKLPNDPRVTRVGQFLRRTSLDELPQFFNVLKGDMSLVGPRPELPILVEKYETWQRKRFAVPQGITGWWQVNGRSDKLMHLNTEDDLYYVQNYSLLLDLQILLKTVWVVLSRRGAF